MKKITLIICLLIASISYSQNTVTVDVNASWAGYMNVFDTGGAFQFGQPWGVSDLKTTIGASDITLQPNYNAYGDGTDPYWANGAIGNKLMEASTYVEPGATFNGVDLTFTGTVDTNNLDSGWTAEYFIKALDPNAGFADALGGSKVIALPASGNFSVTATGAELAPGLIIQYGFRIYGLNANPANEVANGSVVVSESSLSVERNEIQDLSVYPNPTSNKWIISTLAERITAVEVYDMLGKRVISIDADDNTTRISIDGENLAKGMYVSKISSENGVSTRKLIKN